MADKPKVDEAPKAAEPAAKNEKTLNELVADAVRAAVTEAVPLATAMATKVAGDRQPIALPPLNHDKCGECGQVFNNGRGGGCMGKHRLAVVYPQNEDFGEWFQGVKINGVLYRSNHSQHRITVPEDCNIEHLVQVWEQGEKRFRNPATRNHNSGHIGMGGSGFVPGGMTGWGS